MTVEHWNDEMLDRLAETVSNLAAITRELREGQAMLTEFFVQDREAMQDFRQTTRATLDRIEAVFREERATTQAALDRIDRVLDYLVRRDG